ncbi:MAG TPA: HAD family phosphatase [Steroidobacteraceae bacterium]|nr:HAD family phosphatase [Steroidobacteraceae bacterium]
MSPPGPVRALLFDLDGTLVDTETHTDEAIGVVVARYGVHGFALPPAETRGRTWAHVAQAIRAQAPIDAPAAALAAELLEYWDAATARVRPIPGAPEALRAAAERGLKLAVVSSSPRAVIARLLGRLGVAGLVAPEARIGGDDVRRGKPDPEGFLRAARALGVGPHEALVFEDSRAGLEAARAAGMRSMFVTCVATDVAELTALATASFTDYRRLPASLWDELAAGAVGLAGRTFT